MTHYSTLFSRYKRMINLMWAEGERKYTAAELNLHVGHYERITSWKRANNNPFYSTRTYQTALKQLGCITKIKRGLWQINGPIPEWFGSFHISALNNNYALQELEKSSFFWQSLPAEHKVNPWKNIDPMRVMASMQPLIDTENQRRRDELNATLDAVKERNKQTTINTQNMTNEQLNVIDGSTTIDNGMISTSVNFTVKAPFGVDFNCTSWVNLHRANSGAYEAEIMETEIQLSTNKDAKYKDILNMLNLMMGEAAADAWLESLDKYGMEQAAKLMPTVPTVSTPTPTANAMYTADDVKAILKRFADHVTRDVRSAIDNECDSIDESDCVDIDFDSYDRRINVELSTGTISRQLSDAVSDQIEMSYDDFDFETNNDTDNQGVI